MSETEIKSGSLKRVGHEALIIGQNLKTLRNTYGYSQRQVAGALNTSFQQIQKYEKGQNRISAEKLHYLKNFFGVPYARFFEGLSGAQGKDPHNPADMARIVSAKMAEIEDVEQLRRLFRALMILIA